MAAGSADVNETNPIDRIHAYGLESIRLSNVVLFLNYEGHHFQIPMEAAINISKKAPHILDCDAKFSPFGQTILVSTHVDPAKNVLLFDVNAKDLILEAFSGILSMVPDVAVSGRGDVSASGEFGLTLLQLKNTILEAEIKGFNVKAKDMLFVHPNSNHGSDATHIQVTSKEGAQWQVAISGLSVRPTSDPIFFDVRNFKTVIGLHENRIDVNGGFALGFDDMAYGFGIKAKGDTRLQYDAVFDGFIDTDRQWQMNLTNGESASPPPPTWDLLFEGVNIRTRIPEIKLSGKGQGAVGELLGSMSFSNVSAQKDSLKTKIPYIRIKGKGLFKEGNVRSDLENRCFKYGYRHGAV